MGRLTILGSASAVPGEHQENTHLMVSVGSHTILIDCGSNPIQHLRRAGVSLESLTEIILTHFHPDHVSGLPLLLMGMWLMGRRTPIKIFSNSHTLERTKTMMALFDWQSWPDFYPVTFIEIENKEMCPVIVDEEFRLYASPVKHLIPTIGLRMEFPRTGMTIAYSSDTEPCSSVVNLAGKAEILIHEAAGASIGHSSPAQAAEIGNRAGAETLYLIHYPPEKDTQELMAEAQHVFGGRVILAKDFLKIDF